MYVAIVIDEKLQIRFFSSIQTYLSHISLLIWIFLSDYNATTRFFLEVSEAPETWKIHQF